MFQRIWICLKIIYPQKIDGLSSFLLIIHIAILVCKIAHCQTHLDCNHFLVLNSRELSGKTQVLHLVPDTLRESISHPQFVQLPGALSVLEMWIDFYFLIWTMVNLQRSHFKANFGEKKTVDVRGWACWDKFCRVCMRCEEEFQKLDKEQRGEEPWKIMAMMSPETGWGSLMAVPYHVVGVWLFPEPGKTNVKGKNTWNIMKQLFVLRRTCWKPVCFSLSLEVNSRRTICWMWSWWPYEQTQHESATKAFEHHRQIISLARWWFWHVFFY